MRFLSIASTLGFFFVALSAAVPATYAQDAPLTPKALEAALATKPVGEDAAKLADRVREWFGKDKLLNGIAVKTDGADVAWAVEAPGTAAPPTVLYTETLAKTYQLPAPSDIRDTASHVLQLTRLGDTPVYAATHAFASGDLFEWTGDVGGQKSGGGRLELYAVPPENLSQPNVPKGTVTQMPKWTSKVFDGTQRDWWVYVPTQYKPENPACVMVFQDGGGYKDLVPIVFDNLIARGDMPVTVGIFLNPGAFPGGRSDRSFEYDTLSDQYARFLLEEILPEVEKTTKLRHDPESRALAGLSSGGICSFTVAWERPDQFSKVLSWIGSFTGIASGKTLKEGGNNYPVMIRKSPAKPIRVFLQDGENDLDNDNGNWPLSNQQMAKALAFKQYDYRFVFGHGTHSPNHGRSILPDSLRWLWRDYKPQ